MLDVDFLTKRLRKMKGRGEKFTAVYNGRNFGAVLTLKGVKIGWIPTGKASVKEQYIRFNMSNGERAFLCPYCGYRARSLYLINNKFVCNECTNKLIWEDYND